MSKFISIFRPYKGISASTRACVDALSRKGFKLVYLNTHIPRCQFRNIVYHVYDERYAKEYRLNQHVLARAGVTTLNLPEKAGATSRAEVYEEPTRAWDVLPHGATFSAIERPRKSKSLPVLIYDLSTNPRIPTTTVTELCNATVDTNNLILICSEDQRYSLNDVPHEHEHRIKFSIPSAPVDFEAIRAIVTNDEYTALKAVEAATPVFLTSDLRSDYLVDNVEALMTAKLSKAQDRQSFLDSIPRAPGADVTSTQ